MSWSFQMNRIIVFHSEVTLHELRKSKAAHIETILFFFYAIRAKTEFKSSIKKFERRPAGATFPNRLRFNVYLQRIRVS
jgi:hypothetical protein